VNALSALKRAVCPTINGSSSIIDGPRAIKLSNNSISDKEKAKKEPHTHANEEEAEEGVYLE
jgi:hypothetical protein